MKRDIIKIDEEKCTGCGLCSNACPEGAIQIIKGKAILVGELLCDGLGACLGHCPEGAITIEKREAEKYDERKVMQNIIKGGRELIKVHLKHLNEHRQKEYLRIAEEVLKEKGIKFPELSEEREAYSACGCPGSKIADFRKEKKSANVSRDIKIQSELKQWPVELHLISPSAPYFENADLLIAADCVPVAYADFHREFLKGKSVAIFCPKLDEGIESYVDKLAEIIKNNSIKSITTVHMEVPCCYGTSTIVEKALAKSGKTILVKDYTVSIKGEKLNCK